MISLILAKWLIFGLAIASTYALTRVLRKLVVAGFAMLLMGKQLLGMVLIIMSGSVASLIVSTAVGAMKVIVNVNTW